MIKTKEVSVCNVGILYFLLHSIQQYLSQLPTTCVPSLHLLSDDVPDHCLPPIITKTSGPEMMAVNFV